MLHNVELYTLAQQANDDIPQGKCETRVKYEVHVGHSTCGSIPTVAIQDGMFAGQQATICVTIFQKDRQKPFGIFVSLIEFIAFIKNYLTTE